MARLSIRVIPKAGADQVAGLRAGELLVRVKAAPEAGKANASACRAVAGFLGVPQSHIQVVRGHTSRHKVLAIEGLSEDDLTAKVTAAERLE